MTQADTQSPLIGEQAMHTVCNIDERPFTYDRYINGTCGQILARSIWVTWLANAVLLVT